MSTLFRSPTTARVGLFIAIAAGAVLRLLWHEDIEYKADQVWTFLRVQEFWATGQIPMIGMTSSVGPPNPPMSQWVFIALSAFVPVDEPLALTRAVEWVNILAILALLAFVWKCVASTERESWLWSVALVAVNPFAIHFSRCIWQMNLFPLPIVGFLLGWWYRSRWWGAFLWGSIGALLGQIHMPAYFFAAAFFLCTVVFDRRSVRWMGWAAGSVLGALPMIPWLMAIAEIQPHVSSYGIENVTPAFLQHWLNMATGVGLRYSLGNDFADFVGPWSSYAVAILMAVIVAIVATIGVTFVRRLLARRQDVAPLFSVKSPTVLILASAMLGYGLLMIVTLRPVYLHYFVIAFSLPALSVAWAAQACAPVMRRAGLAGLVVAQAGLSFAFLAYIHDREIIDGDYGTVYHALPAEAKR